MRYGSVKSHLTGPHLEKKKRIVESPENVYLGTKLLRRWGVLSGIQTCFLDHVWRRCRVPSSWDPPLSVRCFPVKPDRARLFGLCLGWPRPCSIRVSRCGGALHVVVFATLFLHLEWLLLVCTYKFVHHYQSVPRRERGVPVVRISCGMIHCCDILRRGLVDARYVTQFSFFFFFLFFHSFFSFSFFLFQFQFHFLLPTGCEFFHFFLGFVNSYIGYLLDTA